MKRLAKKLLVAFLVGSIYFSGHAFAEQLGGFSGNADVPAKQCDTAATSTAASGQNENVILIRINIEGNQWLGPFKEGEVAGTTGQGKQIEAIELKMLNGTDVEYSVYVDGKGWSDWIPAGNVAGVPGSKKAIIGIKIKSDGSKGEDYIICRAHVGGQGWDDFIDEGEVIGDLKHRIEAIKVQVVD